MSRSSNVIAPGVRLHDPAYEVEEGAFAGPVGTDESYDLPLAQGEADPVDGHHPAKVLAHILHFKEWHISSVISRGSGTIFSHSLAKTSEAEAGNAE